MTHEFDDVRRVADHELLSRLERLVKADRALSVKLLVHLGEVEARKLYLERGFSSMYDYCSTALGMSEAETYLRLLAAKSGKRFPLVLERLADGGLHLTAIKLLHPLLTEENHAAVLDRARGLSKRQIEVLMAELAPKADVPERLRKLPELRVSTAVVAQRSVSAQDAGAAPLEDGGSGMLGGRAVAHSDVLRSHETGNAMNAGGHGLDAVRDAATSQVSTSAVAAAAAPFVLQPPAARSAVSPLRPGRFKLELTLGQETYDQLQQLRELLRHQNPSGEITSIVERALRELLERTLKRRFAQTGSPRRPSTRAWATRVVDGVGDSASGSPDASDGQSGCSAGDFARDDDACCDSSFATRLQPLGDHGGDADVARIARVVAVSRYVPRRVLREVYARDAGQCSYVSADGRRCSARGFLEVHHHEAFARGGAATVDNLRLACRAHNFWLAERELGPAFMSGKLLGAASSDRASETKCV
jgi:hypothetical protein